MMFLKIFQFVYMIKCSTTDACSNILPSWMLAICFPVPLDRPWGYSSSYVHNESFPHTPFILQFPYGEPLSTFEFHPHIREPALTTFDMVLWMSIIIQNRLERSKKLKWPLVQLHPRKFLTKTDTRTISKSKLVLLVLCSANFILKPSLRTEFFEIGPIEIRISMHNIWVTGELFEVSPDQYTTWVILKHGLPLCPLEQICHKDRYLPQGRGVETDLVQVGRDAVPLWRTPCLFK